MSQYVNQSSWPSWARNVASPAAPDEYVEAAVDRLMDKLHPYVVDVKNVRPQFDARNGIKMIEFDTKEEREYYQKAFDRYLEAVGKLEASDGPNTQFLILVEWLKFRQAAEFCRCETLAKMMRYNVQEGFAAVAAMCFKPSMAKTAYILNTKFGVPRAQISLIWGGSASFTQQEGKRVSKEEIIATLSAAARGEAVDSKLLKRIKQQLIYDSEGLGNLPTDLDLGPQDYKKRQIEIDRFQSGQSHYCLFNFKSGGVGLSLHHCDDMTKQKVRRKKESGYAYVEDIPSIPTRPRRVLLTPTFSAIELVQGLGRAARITSLSDTEQIMLFYRGTIEERVAAAVSQKLKCLKKVVRQRETWEDIITARNKAYNDIAQQPPVLDEDFSSGSDLFDMDETPEDNDEDQDNID
jgi:hypothetical protein